MPYFALFSLYVMISVAASQWRASRQTSTMGLALLLVWVLYFIMRHGGPGHTVGVYVILHGIVLWVGSSLFGRQAQLWLAIIVGLCCAEFATHIGVLMLPDGIAVRYLWIYNYTVVTAFLVNLTCLWLSRTRLGQWWPDPDSVAVIRD